jgi:hypothetical protein
LIFNINYFNSNNVLQSLSPLPTPTSYNKISLFGGAKFDDLWGENYIRTVAQINQLDLYAQPQWTVNTICLAHFNSNLQGGNIISLPSSIDGWIIQRRANGDAKFTTIATVGASVDTYEDRLVSSKETYIYQLIPKTGTVLGSPLESDPVSTDFRSVIVLNPITQEGYNFCLNTVANAITINEDVTQSDTKGKYQTILKGNRRFKSGSISTIAKSNSTVDGINQDIKFLDQLEDFIQSSDEKIIKFPKGFTIRAVTFNMNYTQLDGVDQNGNTLWAVSFDFVECGEV